MAGKSRYGRKHYTPVKKKPAPAPAADVAAQPSTPAPAAPPRSETRAAPRHAAQTKQASFAYPHFKSELARIGILTGIAFATLIILSLVLT